MNLTFARPAELARATPILAPEGSTPSTCRSGDPRATAFANRPWPQPTSRIRPRAGTASRTRPSGANRWRARTKPRIPRDWVLYRPSDRRIAVDGGSGADADAVG